MVDQCSKILNSNLNLGLLTYGYKPASPEDFQPRKDMFIDFTKLPNDLKTSENREKFDKNENAYIDGDEVEMLHEAYPYLNLNKLKSDNIASVKVDVESYTGYYGEYQARQYSYAYDKNGNMVEENDLGLVYKCSDRYDRNGCYAGQIETTRNVAKNEIEKTTYEYDKKGNLKSTLEESFDENGDYKAGTGKKTTVTKNVKYNGKPGFKKTEVKYDGLGKEVIYEKGERWYSEEASDWYYSPGYKRFAFTYDAFGKLEK